MHVGAKHAEAAESATLTICIVGISTCPVIRIGEILALKFSLRNAPPWETICLSTMAFTLRPFPQALFSPGLSSPSSAIACGGACKI